MILQQTKKEYKNYSIIDLRIEPPRINVSDHVLFGCDPGTTKFGLAYLWKNICHIYEIKIIRSSDPVVRILLTQEIMSIVFFCLIFAHLWLLREAVLLAIIDK